MGERSQWTGISRISHYDGRRFGRQQSAGGRKTLPHKHQNQPLIYCKGRLKSFTYIPDLIIHFEFVESADHFQGFSDRLGYMEESISIELNR